MVRYLRLLLWCMLGDLVWGFGLPKSLWGLEVCPREILYLFSQ